MRYLTKSRFKLALECLTKLYYTGKPDKYSNQLIDDPFLYELARGGFQVGELAKFLLSESPVSEGITIESLDHAAALTETKSRLSKHEVVIAEAAFAFESLFVRVDLVHKKGHSLKIYEVKAKSIGRDSAPFITKRRPIKVHSKWEKYLYDIAFQKYVVTNSLRESGFDVSAALVLANKDKASTVDGLNQKFKILRSHDGRMKVVTNEGLRKSDVDTKILEICFVDAEIDRILNEFDIPTGFEPKWKFEEFVKLSAEAYANDRRVFTPLDGRCKKCEFARPGEVSELKDGRLECWTNAAANKDDSKDFVFELPLKDANKIVKELVEKGKFTIVSVGETDLGDIQPKVNSRMTWNHRRLEQVARAKAGTSEPYLDKNGLKKEMAGWKYPLHMIDFETTRTALPFNKGRKPYEGIAFQFSHHIIDEHRAIRQAGQFLSFEPGAFPNYDFVRELKKQLETDAGSVFRYHIHENTFLDLIYRQLTDDPNPPADKDDLQNFIKSIVKGGERAMVDLYDLVFWYYFSPTAKGSTSLKKILPAIIHDSRFLREKYSQPVYGRSNEIHGLNFENHTWIREDRSNDPYKTLEPLFPEYGDESLDAMIAELEGIDDGGTAMTAYNLLQFSEILSDQRKRIQEGLLRYCELDTMAMVMLVEAWWDLMKSS